MPHPGVRQGRRGRNRHTASRCLLILALAILLNACAAPPDDPVPPPTGDAPPAVSDSGQSLWWMRLFLTSQLTPSQAERVFGPPHEVTGSGLLIYIYHLQGNQKLWLGFPGEKPIMYATLESADGTTAELPLW